MGRGSLQSSTLPVIPPLFEAKEKLRQLGYQVDDESFCFVAKGGFSDVYRIKRASIKQPGSNNKVDSADGDDAASSTKVIFKFTEAQRYAAVLSSDENRPETGKRMTTKLLGVLVAESQHLLTLNHPFIVEYIDSFIIEDETRQYPWKASGLLLKEYAGGSLQTVIDEAAKSGSEISESKLRHYFLQLALALEYVHINGLLHLDVRAANVFIEKSPNVVENVKLGDFGTCRTVRDCLTCGEVSSFLLTQLGDTCYFSPERIEQDEKWIATEKDDVWAFGVLVYYAAASTLPFGDSKLRVISNIVNNQPQSLDSKPYGRSASLSCLVERLLQKKPDQRPKMQDIVRDEFFQFDNDRHDKITEIYVSCKDNLYNQLKLKTARRDKFTASRLDDALRQWLEKIGNARQALEDEFDTWLTAVRDVLVPKYKEVEELIRKQTSITKKTQIAGGATGLTGAVISAIGVGLTASVVLAPVGFPMLITGAAVGITGSLATGGAAIAEKVLENINLKEIKVAEEQVKLSDSRLVQLARELISLLPHDALDQKGDLSIGAIDDSATGNLNLFLRLVQTTCKTADVIAGEIAQAAATATMATVGRTTAFVLLPIGAALDIYTIIRASTTLKQSTAADSVDQFLQVLKTKEECVPQIIQIARDVEYMEKRLVLLYD